MYAGQLIEQRSLVSQPVTWEDLESALVSGDIELHGNYIWHQGSRQYDITKAKSDEQKLGQIQQVISILHDPQLSPVEKALSIQQVEGFGENNATGLVMIFDPKNFSLVNTVTRKALGILNEPIDTNKSLVSIQALLQALKEELGAQDFFELDWFLYLIKEGQYLQGLPGEASSKTWLDYITRVLQTADEPLSMTEVAHRAISLGLVTKGKTPAQTASRILTTHPELFEKVERGRYRLKASSEEAIPAPFGQGEATERTDHTELSSSMLDEYVEPPFEEIIAKITSKGIVLNERILRSYYLSLKIGRLIILAGPSGTGKTWLTEVYANAVGAAHQLVPVAPNWTTNEDLLGYADPLQQGVYHDTSFSSFLRQAANEDAFIWMLSDLDTRLPASIAVGLQRAGALTGLRFLPPGQSTLAQEMTRLRRAIKGSQGRIGLAQVLRDLRKEGG